MGIADVTSKVLLEFKADTRQARKEVKKLSGAQKKSAQEAIAAQEKQNAKLKKNIATMGKAALAVGTVVLAYKALSRSVDFFAKRQQLAAASAGADIGRIQAAARGLITEQEAMQFAAAALNTEFKLSQQQMEDVAKFMIVLRNQGNDLAVVQTRLTQAIVEGNSRALRPFGVIVDGTTGKIQTQIDILKEIRKQNTAFGDELLLTGDSFQQMAIAGKDAMDDLKIATAKATLFMADSIRRMVRNASDDLRKLAVMRGATDAIAAAVAQHQLKQLKGLSPAQRALLKKFNAFSARFSPDYFEDIGTLEALDLGGGGGGRGRGASAAGPTPGVGIDIAAEARAALESGREARERFGPAIQRRERFDRAPAGPGPEADETLAQKRKRKFEDMIKQLRNVRSETELLRDSIMGIGDSLTGAFEAWGAGAISLGDALKQALGNAIGDILIGEAKKHIALATADFLTGNPIGGTGHLAAAAALAAASGGIRSLLGGSGGGTSAGGGGGRAPGASAGGFGGGGGGTDRESIIVVPVPFGNNPRKQSKEIADAIRSARNREGGGTTVQRR